MSVLPPEDLPAVWAIFMHFCTMQWPGAVVVPDLRWWLVPQPCLVCWGQTSGCPISLQTSGGGISEHAAAHPCCQAERCGQPSKPLRTGQRLIAGSTSFRHSSGGTCPEHGIGTKGKLKVPWLLGESSPISLRAKCAKKYGLVRIQV